MKFTVDNGDLPPGLSRLIDLEASVRVKQLPGDGKDECHECGELAHTRPVLAMTDSGPMAIELCEAHQREFVERELEAQNGQDLTPDREPTLSDDDLAQMDAADIEAAIDAGDLDPARLEGTPVEGFDGQHLQGKDGGD